MSDIILTVIVALLQENKVSNETEALSLEFPNTVDSAIGLQHAPGIFQG